MNRQKIQNGPHLFDVSADIEKIKEKISAAKDRMIARGENPYSSEEEKALWKAKGWPTTEY